MKAACETCGAVPAPVFYGGRRLCGACAQKRTVASALPFVGAALAAAGLIAGSAILAERLQGEGKASPLDGLDRIGWTIERPKGTMFVWAPIPEPYAELTSQEFATLLVQEAKVAVSPGSGFGPGGEGFVRFALVENEQRITQAVRGLRKALTKLG